MHVMRATIAYTGARLVLFAVALGLIYLIGARGLLLFALALLVSGIASYVLLSRMRDAISSSISGSSYQCPRMRCVMCKAINHRRLAAIKCHGDAPHQVLG